MPDVPNQSTEYAGTEAEHRAALELMERLRSATLGEYDVCEVLGRGGMATVYLAHEISLDRKVAIKVMSPAMVHGAGMVERFKREARTAGKLNHPNIIPIYSVREVDGLLFIVCKLVEGTPLDSIIKELDELPVPMVQGIMAQVGGALGYAHRHGVVHRDIKPANILIDDEGWAVVTDFGIAKVSDNDGLTSTGMAVGTPTYMSPEQATADVATGASDQYSLGVVAYEMLTGRPPFTGTSMMALMYSHVHDEPPPLRDLRPDVPDQLCDAVMRMLRKNPADRFPSMEEAVAASGARALAPDDPTRSQLIALAKTSMTHRIVSRVQTPRSPIPLGKERTGRKPALPAEPAHRPRNPVLIGAGAAGLLAAGFLIAKVISAPAPAPLENAAEPPPVVNSSTDSGSAGTEEIASSQSITNPPSAAAAPRSAASPPVTTRTVEPAARQADNPAATPTQPIPDAAGNAGRGALPQRAESSGVTQQKAETTASLPVVDAPPVTSSAPPPSPGPPITRPVDPAALIQATIMSYARALAASDMAAAMRIYASMPRDQHEGLEALWREGGRMTPSWTVSDINVGGEVATAIVRGTNVVTTRRGQTSTVPVSLRARLERRNGEWRLAALIN
jgi:serine/threonine protein kinase